MSSLSFAKKMGFGKMALACLFLFNPHFSIVDLLPDFVGVILIYSAISSLSSVNGYFGQALYGLKKLVYITGARFAFSCVAIMNGGTSNDNTMGLLYSFVFSVLYLIFFIPVILKIKEGMSFFTMYHECKTISKGTEGLSRFTVFFVILHSVLSALPEFAILFKPDELALPDKSANIYYNMGTYRLYAILIITAVGIVWLALSCIYFLRIKSDKPFVAALCNVYEEKGYNLENSVAEKELKGGLVILVLSFVLSFNIFFENVNIFPNFISCICVILYASRLKKYISEANKIKLLAYLASALSLAKFVLEIMFRDKYSYTQVGFFAGATKMYSGIAVLNLLEALAFLALSIFALLSLKEIINNHTGFLPDITKANQPNERVKLLHTSLCKRVNLLCAFAVLKFAASVYHYIAKVNYGWYFDIALSLDITATALYALFASLTIKVIIDEISARYMIAH